MNERPDILISGGGVAGLVAAATFGSAGFSVVCVDPAPPVTDAAAPGADLRTTAFLQPARALLEEAGIWPRLAAEATALRTMRIVDAGGAVARDFEAQELGDAPFGWNVPNWLMRREVLARLEALPGVDFRSGTGFARMITRTHEALVTLTDGTRLRPRLVLGADGRDSPVRAAAGIGARTIRYGQKAITFAVTHAAPHDNISTEIHRTGGPFTLVPLPDHEGRPCSAVVWMVPGPEARRLLDLAEPAFIAEATERSAGVLGALTLAAPRASWPIIARVAERMSAERTALMAEAAHVLPPIGAQGLNMSLADLRCLLDLARAAPETLGSREMLDRYHRTRHPDILLRLAGIDALNRASIAGAPGLQQLRARGIEALWGLRPVRRTLMQLGLGAGADAT
ncbi:2-octaprenyl-6-methoxyphenyl hydroxylase [Oceanicola granulosus HTCC2516]|uniref:2-octaprenyl-6-methoxyphenyl hydroxylase n=1 Tax=Oceanicola granulosus (strain ATCC BAA-861 / DSM 15982 / KCTC 12143 / HTCC2516) TaxID=314256 RepID=Q2CBG2_OCEGH|nr:UbiH/UbiF family hydroxylase [Oceanicola granulosus]EAR50001.1 2-octaprenyl-6-methoxyphenyl hydroxylase [Oceanicola granulosus HTCC2516]